jgi:glucokinase
MVMQKTFLVWDLGATKCAAAVVAYNVQTQQFHCKNSCHIKLNSVDSLEALILMIEEKLKLRHRDTDAVCIGAAGIYNGVYLHLDNGYPYEMPFAALAKAFRWPSFAIIHDYAPVVCATFTEDIEAKRINNREIETLGRRIAFGVGTGLGLKDGVLLPNGDFWLGFNEMGHVGVSYTISAPQPILEIHHALMQKESPSFEKILSGKGMLRLHQFLHPETSIRTPEELGELINKNKADETLGLFAFYLGLFTGTVQLSFMPTGGIWITGGVVCNHLSVFERPEFFEGINASPAYLTQRETFPLRVLCDTNAHFIGAAYYASKRLNLSGLDDFPQSDYQASSNG